jgi:hemoglobin
MDTPAAPANPHYERLGGHEAVVRLVDAFYAAMEALPEARTVRAMHEADLGPTRRLLVNYLSEWTGGPRLYSAERGAPMLRRRHHPFDIDAAARDAWMACMRQALAATCADDRLRAELDAAFYKVAEFIRNTEPHGATRVHPGRPREQQPLTTTVQHSSQPADGPEPQPPVSPRPGAPL